MKKKITAIVQARIGSSRLRGKVLKKINSKETIILLLERLSRAKKINDIIVAIPNTKVQLLVSNSINFILKWWILDEIVVLKKAVQYNLRLWAVNKLVSWSIVIFGWHKKKYIFNNCERFQVWMKKKYFFFQ